MVEPGSHEHAEDFVDVFPLGLVDPEVLLDHLLDRAEGEGGRHVEVCASVTVVLRVEVLCHPLDVVDLDVHGQVRVGLRYRVGLMD